MLWCSWPCARIREPGNWGGNAPGVSTEKVFADGREQGTVKAMICKEWGKPHTLILEEVGSQSPAAGEARLAVRAAGVNFADNLMIAGRYQFKPPFPFSPGFEVSGVIEELGEDAGELEPGDRVMDAVFDKVRKQIFEILARDEWRRKRYLEYYKTRRYWRKNNKNMAVWELYDKLAAP